MIYISMQVRYVAASIPVKNQNKIYLPNDHYALNKVQTNI